MRMTRGHRLGFDTAHCSDTPRSDPRDRRGIVTFKTGRCEVTLKGIDCVQRFVLPNVYFHTTTTCNMLRHDGVEIGKADFLGEL